MKQFGRMVLLVRDYDEAIAFYTDKFGFEVFVDIRAGERRFVHLRLPSQSDVGLWLMAADTPEQMARVGAQTAGQPCAVLYTDDLIADYERLTRRGVAFRHAPVREADAGYAHMLDLYGNEFVLVELDSSGETK